MDLRNGQRPAARPMQNGHALGDVVRRVRGLRTPETAPSSDGAA